MVFHSDEELVRRIVEEKDRWAGEKLIERYYRWVYKIVYNKLNNRDMVMDVTHEIFLRMIKNLNKFSPEKAKFKTWLHTILSNYVIDVYRNNEAYNCVSIDDIAGEALLSERIDELVEKKVFCEKVKNRILGFEEPDRTILMKKLLDEEKFSSIGEELGLPESSVKTRYYKAIGNLRKEFDEEDK